MKTKLWKEPFNRSYLPSAVKEERIRLSQGLTGELNRQNLTVSENNPNANSVNNTSAYK